MIDLALSIIFNFVVLEEKDIIAVINTAKSDIYAFMNETKATMQSLENKVDDTTVMLRNDMQALKDQTWQTVKVFLRRTDSSTSA